MIANSENLTLRFEVEDEGEVKTIDIPNLPLLPSKGDEVECNYVHGTKIRFEVQRVKHFLYNSGHEIHQQVTVFGKAY